VSGGSHREQRQRHRGSTWCTSSRWRHLMSESSLPQYFSTLCLAKSASRGQRPESHRVLGPANMQ